MMPSRMMAMRSAMVSASSWSWVTITVALERPGQHLLDLAAHGLAQLDVEPAQRLVEEEAVGVANDGARHRDALLLALGDLAGQPVEHARSRCRVSADLAHAPLALGRRVTLVMEREGDVLRRPSATG